MDKVCRLCCSSNFVNNYIFDEETALHLKMSLYMPLKVLKDDRLPQKICNKCSCKVNDFYQFCNEAIEVQNRLVSGLLSSGISMLEDMELKPRGTITTAGTNYREQATQTEAINPVVTSIPDVHVKVEPRERSLTPIVKQDDFLETYDEPVLSSNDDNLSLRKIKKKKSKKTKHKLSNGVKETKANKKSKKKVAGWDDLMCALPEGTTIGVVSTSKVKTEDEDSDGLGRLEPRERSLTPIVKPDDFLETYDEPVLSSDDDNLSLLKIKKKKNKKTKHKLSNGVKETKANKKSKKKVAGWDDLMSALPEGTTIGVVSTSKVKTEDEDSDGLGRLEEEDNLKKIKAEPSVFNCCMCSYQFDSRAEMITHYKEHGDDTDFPCEPPPPPPLPDQDPVRCPRCAKMVTAESWARHWGGHWARDRRPYHCARCECSFKDPLQIFKHGLTHDEEGVAGAGAAEGEKRFICDLCPEGFVYMRYLLAHRTRAHPESVGLALALRCAVCRRSFAHTNSLRRHLRAHTGERNYLCNVCGKSLTSREHLKFHIRIHTGYKPNVCKTCGKGFVKKCNLTLHERTHSGEKPHVCAHCSKAFSQRSTLVIHERYHSGSRPYVCNLCGRGFVAKGLLSMHLKTTCI